ncbi:tripartite tricarboxylate transporter substrate binding protein [Ramlibacter sp. WS9]|uniref:Bug family tripartite tricarboxylate transporter substrate binding protein n=1 Tax=Ramlibacter sp. WS9 TaxID=1882741 RepID=UPI0013051111|nr:tripartite tricarboxylate transporter substrate-binding protein [Ramlibacter sp. WS9]
MSEQLSRFSPTRRELLGTAGGLALLSAVGRAAAQSKPSTIRIVCGYAAGGTSDLLSRKVASNMPAGYANSVIVENKPGALAQLAVSYVKQQPPDGSNILSVSSVLFTLFPFIYKSLPYDAMNDFATLTAGCEVEYGYAVGPMVPASVRTIPEYIAWAKRDAKNATFATAGVLPSMVGTLLAKIGNMELVPVTYKGGAPAVLDTVAGNVPATVTTLGDLAPHLGDGKLRVLAITSDKRNPLLPTVPTFAEQGIADMVIKTYFGFFAHAKTPAELMASHSAAIRSALTKKEIVDSLAQVGMTVVPTDLKQSGELIAQDRARWASVVKRINYQPT